MPTESHSRRRFLQRTVTVAACGLARRSPATESDDATIIDTHVYFGRWPFGCLAGDEPKALLRILRRNNISRAWTGSFDALFHKDIDGTNRRLAETCQKDGDGLLVPFGAVNPTLPDWEEDLRRCHEAFRMPGIRLHANYHGYTLADPRFGRLLELAASRRLIVQIVAHLTDESHVLLNPHTPRVDLAPLAKFVRLPRNVRLLVTTGQHSADDGLLRALGPDSHVYFDFSRIAQPKKMLEAMERVPAERIVFGSAAPLADVAAAIQTMEHAGMSATQLRAMRSGAARRLIHGLP